MGDTLMSAIIQPFSFSHCTTNYPATPSLQLGNTVTANATVNVVGATVTLISAITHDVQYLTVKVSNTAASTDQTSSLVDIMYDTAGGTSWATEPLVANLMAGFSAGVLNGDNICQFAREYHFPIYIKSGTSIGARMKSAISAKPATVGVVAQGRPSSPLWWVGSSITAIGVAASSRGTPITPGTSPSFGSWTNFGSTLARPAGAVQFGVSLDLQNVNGTNYWVQFGVGSTQIGPTFRCHTGSFESMSVMSHAMPIFCNLPTGTQLQARASGGSPDSTIDVAAWVVH